MHFVPWTIAIVVGLFVALHFGWRYASRHWSLPCPTVLSWAVDGRVVDAVEIGPGPGRLLLRAASRVLPGGKAIGVELQQGMLDKIRRKLARYDPGNIELIHADATHAVLPPASADLVYLCTVLGEIPDRSTALRNCFDVLRPLGRLSITEIVFDPHYQSRSKVQELAQRAGFELEEIIGNWRTYTANFRKPGAR